MMATAFALKKPQIKTELPGPKARSIIKADAQFVNPAYPRPAFKLVAERAAGVWVEDVDGNLFLDCNAGVAVCSTGHCHPEVVAAIQEQAAQLIHMCGTDFYYRQMPELAEKLDEIVPVPRPTKTHFANSGTEAVETALKLAMHATGREKFIAFFGSFHGRTLGSLSLTSSKIAQRIGFKRQALDVVHVPYPNDYRNPFSAEDCGEADRQVRLAAFLGFDLLIRHHERSRDVLVLKASRIADVEVFHALSALYLISRILTIPKDA